MDLADLYRDVIIDHNRNPRNFRRIEPPCEQAEGHNPLCGDKLHVYLKLDGDRIEDAAFEGSGCAISVASASLMTEAVIGTTAAEARDRIRRMYAVLKGEAEADPGIDGKLAALAGVRQYPTRVKCASLCWHTVESALESGAQVSTE
jgi:nitrogen fixation NifU-like protein